MFKENALEIISVLELRLSTLSPRGRPIPISLQVLIMLRFLAAAIFHCEICDLCGASEAIVRRIVHKVPRATMFTGQASYEEQFREYGQFPGVVDCIDGCHPSTCDAEKRNRKH